MAAERENDSSQSGKQVQDVEFGFRRRWSANFMISCGANNDEDDGACGRTHSGDNCPPGKCDYLLCKVGKCGI
jgi:hypothetical protein